MNDPQDTPHLTMNPRQQAILRILANAGITEGGTDARGAPFDNAPPEGLALMIDMALNAAANEDDVLSIMTWGQLRELWPELRPAARAIVALRDTAAPPA